MGLVLDGVDVVILGVLIAALLVGTWIVARQVGYEECVADFTGKAKE